jgi:drug/metabolite transporter (DMT)-like permease
MKRWQADLVLVGIALIWGATFVMVKNALTSVGPATFIAWRFVAATLTLLVIFHRRMRGLRPDELRAGILLGLWLGTGYVLQTTGLQHTTTGKTGFITGMNVVIVPILSAMLFGKPPGWKATAGTLVAVIGMGLLSLDANLRVQSGDLWVLGGAVAFALHIVSVSEFAAHHDPIRVAIVQLGAGAILVTGAAFVFEIPSLILPAATWEAIVFTGVVATALVFSTQIAVQRFTTSTHAALILSLESPFAAFFGWWWASEWLGSRELLGCALIMVGIVIAELSGRAHAGSEEIAPTLAADPAAESKISPNV